jgi:hypothetical protein
MGAYSGKQYYHDSVSIYNSNGNSIQRGFLYKTKQDLANEFVIYTSAKLTDELNSKIKEGFSFSGLLVNKTTGNFVFLDNSCNIVFMFIHDKSLTISYIVNKQTTDIAKKYGFIEAINEINKSPPNAVNKQLNFYPRMHHTRQSII